MNQTSRINHITVRNKYFILSYRAYWCNGNGLNFVQDVHGININTCHADDDTILTSQKLPGWYGRFRQCNCFLQQNRQPADSVHKFVSNNIRAQWSSFKCSVIIRAETDGQLWYEVLENNKLLCCNCWFLQTFIREVLRSNLGRVTGFPDWSCLLLSSVSPPKCRDSNLSRPWPSIFKYNWTLYNLCCWKLLLNITPSNNVWRWL
jgi:hypothetical protein